MLRPYSKEMRKTPGGFSGTGMNSFHVRHKNKKKQKTPKNPYGTAV